MLDNLAVGMGDWILTSPLQAVTAAAVTALFH